VLQNICISFGDPVLISSLGFLVMPCATGSVNEETTVKERAATVSATALDDQATDNVIRYKSRLIHVAYRSFYSKLVYINHLKRQFNWNCPITSNNYVTALLRASKRQFFHREGISIELFLVTRLLANKLQEHFVHFS
jgi:hypothetical protein